MFADQAGASIKNLLDAGRDHLEEHAHSMKHIGDDFREQALTLFEGAGNSGRAGTIDDRNSGQEDGANIIKRAEAAAEAARHMASKAPSPGAIAASPLLDACGGNVSAITGAHTPSIAPPLVASPLIAAAGSAGNAARHDRINGRSGIQRRRR